MVAKPPRATDSGLLTVTAGPPGVTLNTKVEVAVLRPSLTLIEIVVEPTAPVLGVIVTVRFGPVPPKTTLDPPSPSSTTAGLDEVWLSWSDPRAVSGSATVKAIGAVAVFLPVVCGPIALMVGAPDRPTLSVKLALAVLTGEPLSVTVKVMTDWPTTLAGVIVTERLVAADGPAGLTTMLAFGTTEVLEDEPVTVS
jgi:hypothetical protein